MKQISVAWKLREIADLLVLLGESHFKVRAYQQAASRLENLTEDLEEVRRLGRLTEIKGIGKSTAVVIEEILDYGDSSYLNELKIKVAEFETSFKVKTNYKKKLIKVHKGEILLDVLFPLANEFINRLKRVTGVKQVLLGGSGRRYLESVSCLTLVASTTDPKKLVQVFARLPECREVLNQSEDRVLIMNRDGILVELFVVKEEYFAQTLLATTGSKKHLELLQNLGKERGWRYKSNYWLNEKGEELIFLSEKEIYQKLDLEYIIPELRDGEEAILAAKDGMLPQSVKLEEIKGDLHLHTRWSDGINSIEEMALKAQTPGYEYIAICDYGRGHSTHVNSARGMKPEMLEEQLKEIDELNARLVGIQILKGIEVEILKDGQLALPDRLLSKLDLVIAAVHSNIGSDREALTDRIIVGMKNPFVNMIAHPAGRLVGQSEPYSVNIKRLIEAAKRTGTILELNSRPNRLDLSAEYLKLCKTEGVLVAINSDAYSLEQLGYIEYGLGIARRGWLEGSDVLNTYSLDRLLTRL